MKHRLLSLLKSQFGQSRASTTSFNTFVYAIKAREAKKNLVNELDGTGHSEEVGFLADLHSGLDHVGGLRHQRSDRAGDNSAAEVGERSCKRRLSLRTLQQKQQQHSYNNHNTAIDHLICSLQHLHLLISSGTRVDVAAVQVRNKLQTRAFACLLPLLLTCS